MLGNGKETKLRENNFMTCCPAHDDRNPSLSIHRVAGRSGDFFRFHCFAGCHPDDIRLALQRRYGVDQTQLFESVPSRSTGNKHGQRPKRPDTRFMKPASPSVPPVVSNPKPLRQYAAHLPDKRPPTARELAYFTKHDNIKVQNILHTLWSWHNREGTLAFHTVRYHDPLGHKSVVPLTPWIENDKIVWKRTAPCTPAPLYDLHLDRPGPVLIVEGEKKVEAAKRLLTRPSPLFGESLPWITTTIGGSNRAWMSDLSPLDGRDIYICPDHDSPGLRYASQFLASSASRHFLLRLPVAKCPDGTARATPVQSGYDLADYEEEGGTLKSLEQASIEHVLLYELKTSRRTRIRVDA